jgi:hypothetical protein
MADHSEEGQLPSPPFGFAGLHLSSTFSYTLATKQFAKFLVDKHLTAATKEYVAAFTVTASRDDP